MLICSCHAVSEEELCQLAKDCGGCVRSVQSVCGAGTDCGACIARVEAIVARRGCRVHPSLLNDNFPINFEKIPAQRS